MPFRLADACEVVAITPEVLKIWFARKVVTIESGYGGKWADFSVRDLCRLTLTKQLVDSGFSIADAFDIAGRAIADRGWTPKLETDPTSILSRPRQWLFIWNRNEESDGRPDWKFRWGEAEDVFSIPADKLLQLNMNSIFDRAIKRILKIRRDRTSEKQRA